MMDTFLILVFVAGYTGIAIIFLEWKLLLA